MTMYPHTVVFQDVKTISVQTRVDVLLDIWTIVSGQLRAVVLK